MNTTPFWMDTATLPEFPPLDRNLEVDVAVIGGGIAGITAAYLLKKAGRTVALFERKRCATGETGHTTAHLTHVMDSPLTELVKRFGRNHAEAAWDAGAAAIAQIHETMHAENIDCEFTWVPGFYHGSIESDRNDPDAFRREAELAQELGFEAEFVESVPVFGKPGVRFANQAKFHPLKYLAGLVKTIPGEGSHVFEQTDVHEFSREPLAVKVGPHTVRCGYVVIATHNPIVGERNVLSASLLQTKLALYNTYAIGARLPRESAPEASFWDTTDPYYYLRIDRREDGDYAIWGGKDHKTGQAADTQVCFRELEQSLRRFLPEAQVDHHWSGQVIETPDGLPYIGEVAAVQFAGTGFSGNGMTFGTLTGMMACDAALGRKNPWSALFDPHRKKLSSTLDYLIENKDYPFYMLKDRLRKSQGRSPDDVSSGEAKILRLGGKRVAAYRDKAGKLTLLSPVCTHMGCHVHWNQAEETWDCPCHGSRFKPSGEVVSGPAEAPLRRVTQTGD